MSGGGTGSGQQHHGEKGAQPGQQRRGEEEQRRWRCRGPEGQRRGNSNVGRRGRAEAAPWSLGIACRQERPQNAREATVGSAQRLDGRWIRVAAGNGDVLHNGSNPSPMRKRRFADRSAESLLETV
jgi:hypothetical protein